MSRSIPVSSLVVSVDSRPLRGCLEAQDSYPLLVEAFQNGCQTGGGSCSSQYPGTNVLLGKMLVVPGHAPRSQALTAKGLITSFVCVSTANLLLSLLLLISQVTTLWQVEASSSPTDEWLAGFVGAIIPHPSRVLTAYGSSSFPRTISRSFSTFGQLHPIRTSTSTSVSIGGISFLIPSKCGHFPSQAKVSGSFLKV